MPRKVEVIEDWVDYIPDVEENREDDEPLIVEIRPITSEQMRAYGRRGAARNSRDSDIVRGQKLVERIFQDRVRDVRNYQVGDRIIATGKELSLYGETEVINDVFTALTEISRLKEGMPEKLSSQSASSSPGTARPGNGAAIDAKGMTTAESRKTNDAGSETVTEKKTQASHGSGPPVSADVRGPN